MRKIVALVVMAVAVMFATVVTAQEAPVNGTAVVMCGLLEVPSGCTCKDNAKNELDCPKGVVQVVAPAGKGKMVMENGGKMTVYVPAAPIAPLQSVQPETKDAGFWDYALYVGGAVALGACTYYVVDSVTTTEVHIRDK
ncbi:MAG: hypothetical protein V1902_03865 [Candidatus Falkowbacteria bacterium]